MLARSLLLLSAAGVCAAARPRGALGRAAAVADGDCSNLPGVWTGFVGARPLYDEYSLQFEAGAPPGEFAAVVIRGAAGGGEGWTLGTGQLSADNRSALITFDTGTVLHGNVSADCSTIAWLENGSSWQESSGIDVVHLLSMSHIDVGYHVGYGASAHIIEVLQTYVDIFFPRAVAIARALRALGGAERLLYTSHAWLLSLYLDCPVNLTLSGATLRCPSAAAVQELRLAIQAGDVYFHAGAFNLEYEQAVNSDVIDFSLSLARGLADELGVPRPWVLSLRDVPGTTRALVPILVRNNISAISIGVNDAAPNAAMPNPGVWRDAASNSSVLYMQTGPGICYPWPPGPDPLHPGGLGVPSCVVVPGLKHAMCWVFRVDNAGPPESVQEVLDAFTISRWQFPGAQVWASTFENFTQHLAAAAPALNVTEAEAGDNWMQSTTADPYKISWYREAARAYADCVAAGGCDAAHDARLFQFLRMLIKTPEHTFGTPDYYDTTNAWSNAAFHAAVAAGQPAYLDALSTYTEQRDMVAREGLRYLADHPLAAAIVARVAALQPARPDTAALVALPRAAWAAPITVPGAAGQPPVRLALDAATGALATLELGGAAWAAPGSTLGALSYRTYDDADLATQGAFCCFGHAGRQAAAQPNSSATAAALAGVWLDSAAAPSAITALLTFPAPLHQLYGAPAEVWVTYAVSGGAVNFTLQVFNKTATRLAEAALLSFAAPPGAGAADAAWLLRKLGSWVDPLDAVAGGSPHSHGVSDGVALASRAAPASHALFVDSLDAAVFSPATAGSPATNFIVPADALAGPVTSMAALLWQNAFNTNTPLFTFDSAFKWRFVLRATVPAAVPLPVALQPGAG